MNSRGAGLHVFFGLLSSAGMLALLAGPCQAQSARLEVRIVPQSGIPGAASAPPQACVFDDPAGIVLISSGVAKRFELQGRVVDSDAGASGAAGGLLSARVGVTSTRAGLWGRALLSSDEARPAVDPPSAGATADCSGRVVGADWRGVHGAFRAWDDGLLSSRPHNEDARNGVFSSTGISGVVLAAVDATNQGSSWTGLFSFEYTLPADQAGEVGLSPRVEQSSGAAFTWVTSTGGVVNGTAVITTGVLLRAPAPAVACCARDGCYIALTSSACFANAGRLARTGALGGCTAASCCPADFNGDGAVGVQDVFDFVEAYLLGDPRADINGRSGITTQDVFDFLGLWFAGCPA